QPVDIVEPTEDRIDRAVIAHVVAEVDHRRSKERRDPDPVDAEARDIVQLPGDARQIADPVAVAVAKAARIDGVEDGCLPPRVRHDRLPASFFFPSSPVNLGAGCRFGNAWGSDEVCY